LGEVRPKLRTAFRQHRGAEGEFTRCFSASRLAHPAGATYAARVVNLDQGGSDRARARILPAPPDLADLVESAWMLVGGEAGAGASWRIVPDASANIVVVVPKGGAGPRAGIVGARSTFADIDASNRRLTLGIRLRPGALPMLVREHAASFTDRGFPLEDVLGASWRDALQGIEERDPQLVLDAIFARMRRAEMMRPRRTPPVGLAAARATSVAEMAQTLSLSARTLHDRTRESIGLSPKRVLRILRLHRALAAQPASRGWAEVAADAGFSDQAHLVRDVRELLGETPTEWLARGTPRQTTPPIRSSRARPRMGSVHA
jgi:AraC-like DNA-binding protein